MPDYNFKKIEQRWSKKWLQDKIYEPLDFVKTSTLRQAQGKNAKRFYNLMMFPYPSAEGLHVGNMYAFVGSDIYGRKKRMEGFDVFEPIGLDGFGIHSENYAIQVSEHPKKLALKSEKNFYRQLKMIGNGFSWDEHLETYDPEYYKWTQWIFVQMFKMGLAVRKKAAVNWCSKCLTVLADEQVLVGECERCATKVIKRELEQWFFKITDYAERLLEGLGKTRLVRGREGPQRDSASNGIDWSERVKIAQKNWIGRSDGAIISFEIGRSAQNNAEQTQKDAERIQRNSASDPRKSATLTAVNVFTTRPDTILGATYLVLSPEHSWLTQEIQNPKSEILNKSEVQKYINKSKTKTEEERIAKNKEKTGVEIGGIKAINPATKEEIPVWVADFVLVGYGTGAIMAVPAYDERDREFAEKFNLPISDAPLVDKEDAIRKVGGQKQTNYHLRDWLISRQRYWGPPIPLIFCENCKKLAENPKSQIRNPKFNKGELENPGWIAVDEKDLPVLLPETKEFRPTGTDKSPLAMIENFIKTKCPKCGGEARRETDVSDTFLDSAWYFFRYIDHKNKNEPFNKTRAKHWLPVDMYIGGAEHSVLHLLYTRFLTKVFYDWKLLDFSEPFEKFRAHGLLIKDGAKMSKSKGNAVNPDEYIKKFGADVLRMYLMFLGPFIDGGDFRDESIAGIDRFLNRVWRLGSSFAKATADEKKITNHKSQKTNKSQIPTLKTEIVLHQSIKKVGEDIEKLHYNTAISQLMILFNMLEKGDSSKDDFKVFLKLLAPLAPFIAEELWHELGESESIHKSAWPEYDAKKIKEETKIIIVQINGKVRDKFGASADSSDEEIRKEALLRPKIKKLLISATLLKVIVVRNKLINIVLRV